MFDVQCPNCATEGLEVATRDMTYLYRGRSTVIAGVSGAFCAACCEAVLDEAVSARVEREMRAFVQQVDAVGPHSL